MLNLVSRSLLTIVLLLSLTACQVTNANQKRHTNQVVFVTEYGDILISIDVENAPITAANFLRYVDENRLQQASFYRTVQLDNQPKNKIKIEVLQGGLGFEQYPQQLSAIRHETTEKTGILHKNGTISMARLEPGSANSEFFICVNDQPELDFGGKRNPDGQGFAAFGQVISGMGVVNKIHAQANTEQMLNRPIKIVSITRKTR